MPRRHLYSLTGFDGRWAERLPPDTLAVRTLGETDADDIAHLMLRAYAGTIDDEGSVIEDARLDVAQFFSGTWGPPIPEACVGHERDGELVAACLLCDWNEARAEVAGPLVAFILVAPTCKGQGLGRGIASAALHRLAALKRGRVHAFITEGNVPSERVFAALGFKREDRP
ncbi:GNAT family N-acetyltransferase [Caldimonas sp. KR1-144]|uniref:GNAT family N-acetyltransferase n=1 Tax=Caldimonas sp. KR1-144 TaxID=3400911 RepID=UPI003C08C374